MDERDAHEFWRLELIEELHRKLHALDWNTRLDPNGKRRAALVELIERFEAIEAEELRERGRRRA